MFQIPLSETTLGDEEVEAATRVLRSKWLTMGEEVAAFEREFATALGARHAIAVANGTVAIELAYRAAGIGPGDEIIIPAITFIACHNAAILAGARPVLADSVSVDDWTICPLDIERRITPATKAIVTMAHGGHCPDMQAIMDIARRHAIPVIEDACHAPLAGMELGEGSSRRFRHIGTIGLAGTWSFFGNKNMTTGEGGMVTTDSDELAARIRLLRSHGITRSTWDRKEGHAFSYDVAAVGTNARLDEVRAAIGRVQLAKLPAGNATRADVASQYRTALAPLLAEGLQIPFSTTRGTCSHHLFCVLLPHGVERAAVMVHLRECGVQSSIHYPPIHSFTATTAHFASTGGVPVLPVADAIAGRILTLPLFPGMPSMQVEQVAEALAGALRR